MSNEEIEGGLFAGLEVTRSYARAQALADGVLVDVTEEAAACGFCVPVAVTATLHADCVSWRACDEPLRALLRFACETVRACKQAGTDRVWLSLAHWAGRPALAVLVFEIDSEGEPVVTLTLPNEG